MSVKNEIKSEKILVKDIFSNMWFRIPEYQRPYIWGKDEINDLLDDITFAQREKPDQEYFLGSFVFQAKRAGSTPDLQYNENDLLDGQQRMTTLLMLFACIRDMYTDHDVQDACISSIFQKGNTIKKIPERTRITFAIRASVQEFVDNYIKKANGTLETDKLKQIAQSKDDPSLPNMATAILEIQKYLKDNSVNLIEFLTFLSNNVLLIYVATEDLDDAFRLFTILNDRGVPLRNSDILKSQNLGALLSDADKEKYAKLWEESEGELGGDFDRFLNYIRTILVKEKARLSLLDEFEHKVYNPREKDKATGQPKPALLKKGKETFELIEKYLKVYNTLFENDNYSNTGNNFRFDNLLKVMLKGLPSTDWVPPLLRYYEKFGYDKIKDFLVILDNKFSADWIVQYTPTKRIENMNQVIKIIENVPSVDALLGDAAFGFDKNSFVQAIDSAVYGRRFTRYLLLKLDYLYHDDSHKMSIETLSVEHILPQNPSDDSQWRKDFSDQEKKEWTDRLGNLVLISTRKNSSQGRLDYVDKKSKYFLKRINTCPNSLRVLNGFNTWTLIDLKKNHDDVLLKLKKHYGIL
ncbi:MAG TPA: DUF262 domain-containing HNH endonuclease family protein [Marinilabiliaceae bacterium]|nr:DUF262 domain-containing HNH endonuclease family protein [Marinilabiliaceae bacterium]